MTATPLVLDPAAPTETCVDELLDAALDLGASDLHIDPAPAGGLVRARVDGILEPLAGCPHGTLERIVGRIKVLARLVVYQYDRIQEGRMTRVRDGQTYDLRVTILPTPDGERVAIRFFTADGEIPRLERLGFDEGIVSGLRNASRRRQGLLAVVGPMSSGKTTTLHALATGVVREEGARLLVAGVEDPVERRLPGVIQVEVAPERGITFTSALAALLRQDVAVLIVGEIRDAATAAVAVDAALTGHLVLTTFHVGSPLEALERLRHLGVHERLVATALAGVLSQRLIRTLCPACSRQGDGKAVVLPGLRSKRGAVVARRSAGPGCPGCRRGYRRRTARGEWIAFDPSLVEFLLGHPSPESWESEMRTRGVPSLSDDVAALVEDGTTDGDEALRGLRA